MFSDFPNNYIWDTEEGSHELEKHFPNKSSFLLHMRQIAHDVTDGRMMEHKPIEWAMLVNAFGKFLKPSECSPTERKQIQGMMGLLQCMVAVADTEALQCAADDSLESVFWICLCLDSKGGGLGDFE